MDQDTYIRNAETPIVKNKTEARQGTNKAPVHYVLFGGLALAAISFIFMFFMH